MVEVRAKRASRRWLRCERSEPTETTSPWVLPPDWWHEEGSRGGVAGAGRGGGGRCGRVRRAARGRRLPVALRAVLRERRRARGRAQRRAGRECLLDHRPRGPPWPAGPRRVDRAGDGLPGVRPATTSTTATATPSGSSSSARRRAGARSRRSSTRSTPPTPSTTRWSRSPATSRCEITVAAQEVQRSGFPRAYADHEQDARAIASALTGNRPESFTCAIDDERRERRRQH